MKSHYLPEHKSFIRYYEIYGEGEPILYLAGLSFSILGSMLSVATHPKMRHRRAILVDYLGSGFSDHPQNFDYTMESHARSIADVLDNESIKSVTVVGHSMGGTVGIMLALLRPDLVSNLIVGEGNVTSGGGVATRKIAANDKDKFVGEVYPALKKERHEAAIEGDVMSNRLNNLWATVDPAGLYGNSKALVEVSDELKDQFFQLSMPRTFIYGEKTLPEKAGDAGQDAPDPKELEAHGIQIGVVPNAGHGQMFDNLDGFVDVLTTALK
jgi:pimeloyl-ACP methyl ester carboxylesterase